MMCRYLLGEESSAEDPASTAQYPDDIRGENHTPQDDVDFDELDLHNGDGPSENLLSLIYDGRNGDGPPTLLFPNLGPLPIVGFSSQPPPPAGPPVVMPTPHPDVSVHDVHVNGVTEIDGNGNGPQDDGVYVNGLWIPRSELFQQYGGRNPPCLVYHPIPWIRVRSNGSPSHGPRNCRLGRGIQPTDPQYRLYLTRRMPPNRGSWRSPRRAHPSSLSPYVWCLSPPASPPVYEEQQPPLPESSEMIPPNNETPMCQASSSSYVYPGYSFGPPVFTAPVLPLQPSTANKHLVTSTDPAPVTSTNPAPVTSADPSPVTSVDPAPQTSAAPASDSSPKKKKKKKGKTKPQHAMDCSSAEGPVAVPTTPNSVVTSGQTEASECIIHFVDALFRSSLCQAQRQFLQLKHDRLANGYTGECLTTLRQLRTPSPNRDLSTTPTHHDDVDLKVTPTSGGKRSPSIVLTVDGDANNVESYSDRVAEVILRDLGQGQSTATPHIVASRSQLFLEGLESSYAGVNPIERFSAQFVDLVFREVFQKFQPCHPQEGVADSNLFLDAFAEQLLSNIFNSAKREFRSGLEVVDSVQKGDRSFRDEDRSSGENSAPIRLTAEQNFAVNGAQDPDLYSTEHRKKSSDDISANGTLKVPAEIVVNGPQDPTETAQKQVTANNDVGKCDAEIHHHQIEPEVHKTSKPKALVHFLEQGFHAPSSETFDSADDTDDNVSRERYMEGDPALSHLDADFDQELNTLQDKMRRTDQSIYKISYDEISYTDQSEGDEQDLADRLRSVSEEREPVRYPPLARVYENHLRSEIPVHEAETGSEAGSEDVEIIPHRYESGLTSQEKHLYVNKLSLATELLRTHENLPYDDDFKRIIHEERGTDEGTVNLGFVCDDSKVVTTGPKSLARFSTADSGVQSEESDEDLDVIKKVAQPNGSSQGSLIPRDDNKRIGKHVHETGSRAKNITFTSRTSLGYASSNSYVLSVY